MISATKKIITMKSSGIALPKKKKQASEIACMNN
jgi:hypothetical protein